MLTESEIQEIILDAMDDHLDAYTDECCGYTVVDGRYTAATSAAKKILERLYD